MNGKLNRREVLVGATPWQALKLRAKDKAGQILNLLGFPGFIVPMKTYDRLTETHLQVRLTPLFTIISLDAKDYYFCRINGQYDGSGMVVTCDTQPPLAQNQRRLT